MKATHTLYLLFITLLGNVAGSFRIQQIITLSILYCDMQFDRSKIPYHIITSRIIASCETGNAKEGNK